MKVMNTKNPRLTLVGAGPGDPDLLTLKAVKALASADVVLYDALVGTEILEMIHPKARRIFVGKRAGKRSVPQEKTNELIVVHARQHGHVVRLKGGDPFIFGRGYEELDYARQHGIPVEVVPGISSSVGLPANQQVPLTCRGINESFWVLTGTTRKGKLSADLRLAAQSSATIVVLMGIRKLPYIAGIFLSQEKGDTPVMIVQHGSLPNEKVVVGTISDIVEKARREEIGTPGIIVIGEVVRLHPQFAYAYSVEQILKAS